MAQDERSRNFMPNIVSLKFFIPELVLSATVLALLMSSLCHREEAFGRRGDLPSYIAIAGLFIALFFVLTGFDAGTPPIFWGMLILDRPAVFFKVIFIVTTLIIIVFSQKSKELLSVVSRQSSETIVTDNRRPMTDDSAEYYALLTGSVLGMNLLASANNLLTIYLSLEFVSLMSYLLVGYVKDSPRSSEAALKYVLYGAIASGIFLYGASLYYGQTGTLDIGVANFNLRELAQAKACYSLSGLLMLAGFLYKIAAVPMHAWCPDAYEGAPIPITAFLSVAPKAAGFAVLMRVMGVLGVQFNWLIVIAVISAVTMTFGNLAAIPQDNLKRLLAYSSIAHAGYLLMGVACGTAKGNEAVYFYFIAYLIMNLGAFLVVEIVANKFGGETLDIYKGLGRRGPYGVILSVSMTMFLLSLTGMPPFVGFIGKFYIFSAVVDAKLYWLAIVGIINSVISLYYYMRIVKVIFFDAPVLESEIPLESKSLVTVLTALSLATIIFGLAWQWLAELISKV